MNSAPREARCRAIVTGQVSHQSPGADAVSVVLGHVRTLEGDEQPVRRRCQVGATWEPLYRGWLSSCSCLVIHNHEGEVSQTVPSAEERAAIASRVVELRLGVGDAGRLLCLPGESLGPLCPADLTAVWIRCRDGSAKITVDILPA